MLEDHLLVYAERDLRLLDPKASVITATTLLILALLVCYMLIMTTFDPPGSVLWPVKSKEIFKMITWKKHKEEKERGGGGASNYL